MGHMGSPSLLPKGQEETISRESGDLGNLINTETGTHMFPKILFKAPLRQGLLVTPQRHDWSHSPYPRKHNSFTKLSATNILGS